MSVRALHSSVHPLSVVALVLAAGACALAVDEPEAEPSTESAEQAIGVGCSLVSCTENAPTAGDGLLFDELDIFGSPNYAGTRMVGAHLDSGLPVNMYIWRDELWAYDAGGRWYSGTQLIHTIIDFVHVSTATIPPTTTIFQLRVEDYDPQSVMFMAGPREPVPVYAFKARRSPTENFTFDVCNDSTLAPDPTWAGLDHHAVVFRGDRYEPGRKRLMDNDVTNGWSFIACNGSAASKMHLWRHTDAGSFDFAGNVVYPTSLAQRTTLLKAITADYCGNGADTFTKRGTPLAFATAMEPAAYPSPRSMFMMASFEAVWGPNGAYCIDHPRREGVGVTKAWIEKKCKRTTFPFPSCGSPLPATAPPAGWWSTRYAITGNPRPWPVVPP
jgi:hypothetical protein